MTVFRITIPDLLARISDDFLSDLARRAPRARVSA